MGMKLVRAAPTQDEKGIEHLPYYEPKARRRKPGKVALIIPHSNEIPAVLPLRNALAKRLMAEGIEVTTKTETGMMKRGWEVRRRLDEYVEKAVEEDIKARGLGNVPFWRLGPEENKREEALRSELTALQPEALTMILTLHDHLARIRVIEECLRAGNDLVLELHSMNQNAFFGALDICRGFGRIRGTSMLIAQNVIRIMADTVVRLCSELLKGSDEFGEAILKVLDLSKGVGLETSAKKFFRLADRLERRGGRTMIIEVLSVLADVPAGHPMHGRYSWVSRSNFETAYCAVVRKPVALLQEEVEAVAKAIWRS